MKAIVYSKYGPPDVLQLEEVPRPSPKANEVLIKVHAASINSWDYDLLRGAALIRFMGLFRPPFPILGADVAGVIEAVGKDVTKHKPGDEVYGDLSESDWGCFAQYVCANQDVVVLKSPKMTFEQAAATPQAAVMALQGIRDIGKVKSGDKVLLNGGGGGVGTFGIQLCKHYGAEVTAVDRTDKLEMMRTVGADHVIDYTKEDFTKNGKQYDLVLDPVLSRSVRAAKRALTPEGRYVIVGGKIRKIALAVLFSPRMKTTGEKKMQIVALEPSKDLAVLNTLFEEGKVVPVIDRKYTLAETAEAYRYFATGSTKGKLVITVDQK